jgi:hypothetical protein
VPCHASHQSSRQRARPRHTDHRFRCQHARTCRAAPYQPSIPLSACALAPSSRQPTSPIAPAASMHAHAVPRHANHQCSLQRAHSRNAGRQPSMQSPACALAQRRSSLLLASLQPSMDALTPALIAPLPACALVPHQSLLLLLERAPRRLHADHRSCRQPRRHADRCSHRTSHSLLSQACVLISSCHASPLPAADMRSRGGVLEGDGAHET